MKESLSSENLALEIRTYGRQHCPHTLINAQPEQSDLYPQSRHCRQTHNISWNRTTMTTPSNHR